MRSKLLIVWSLGLVLFLVMGGFKESRAEIALCGDKFTVAGFLRYELGIHTAGRNPNNASNHDLSLARTWFQTEWTFQPADVFKLFAKVRIMGDQTYHWDSDLRTYNAFPVDVPEYDWTMMAAREDDFRAEVWELYADISMGNLWLRLGKQQIVWGELIGIQVLDIINPIDLSWNLFFEPEEFENIRIPTWSIRANYAVEQEAFRWLRDLSIEGFVNPGDVVPSITPDDLPVGGAPFNIMPNLPFILRFRETDNRGETEYGVRLGGMVGDWYVTLNYMCLYNNQANSKFAGLTLRPFAVLLDQEYKKIDVYGATLDYAWGEPLNLVASFEGTWIPNQPYADAVSLLPAIRDQGTFKYGISFTRSTKVLPPTFLHASFMMNTLQFTQTVVEGDEDKILGTGFSEVDKTVESIYFSIRQPLWYNNITVSFEVYYDPDGAYLLKPFVNYSPGNHWKFDVYAVFLGGSEKRSGRLGSMSWADTVYGRITYQF